MLMLKQFRVFVFAWGGERGKVTWGGLRNVFGVEASVGEICDAHRDILILAEFCQTWS